MMGKMGKNEKQNESAQNEGLISNAPGQVLPAKDEQEEKGTRQSTEERHSESSLPDGDNGTLGTP